MSQGAALVLGCRLTEKAFPHKMEYNGYIFINDACFSLQFHISMANVKKAKSNIHTLILTSC